MRLFLCLTHILFGRYFQKNVVKSGELGKKYKEKIEGRGVWLPIYISSPCFEILSLLKFYSNFSKTPIP